MNLHHQPVHREHLYDSDERYRSAGYGEWGPGGAEPGFFGPGAAPGQGTPGDFRHGGLGVQGHVAEAPHLPAQRSAGEGASRHAAGGSSGGDFKGGFHAWGRVPEPPHAAGAAQPDEDFDPEYLQWREEQLRSLDEDYRTWRRQKFAHDFSQWRGRAIGRDG